MIKTPTLDKYPRVMQAAVDTHAFKKEPYGASLAFYEKLSEILDSCLQEPAAYKEDLLVINLLLFVAPAAYDAATLRTIAQTYGDNVASVMTDFSRASSCEDFAPRFAPMAYFDKALDIFEHENAATFTTVNIADLERKRALAKVLAERSTDKTTGALYARENKALLGFIAALSTRDTAPSPQFLNTSFTA